VVLASGLAVAQRPSPVPAVLCSQAAGAMRARLCLRGPQSSLRAAEKLLALGLLANSRLRTQPPLRAPAVFAELHAGSLRRVPGGVRDALCAWNAGEVPLLLLDRVPTVAELLGLQGAGMRAVSLLNNGAQCAPFASALEFAMHDLAHAEKFFLSAQYTEQVGFFFTLSRAWQKPAFVAYCKSLDSRFARELADIAVDMNASAPFLVALLNMRLRTAVGRGADGGQPAARPAQLMLYRLLGLPEDVAHAACAVRADRTAPSEAQMVQRYFFAVGRLRLGGESSLFGNDAGSIGAAAGHFVQCNTGSD
jgi:hypothetical protein